MRIMTAEPLGLPPGPMERFPGDFALGISRDTMHFLQRMAAFGDISMARIGGQRIIFVNHPSHIREVLIERAREFVKTEGPRRFARLLGRGLVTSEGPLHSRQRKLLQPAFHREQVVSYVDTMADCANGVAEKWHDGETIDITSAMKRTAIAIVSRTLFGTSIDSDADGISEALTDVIERFPLAWLPLIDLLDRLPLPSTRRCARALSLLDDAAAKLLSERDDSAGGALLHQILTIDADAAGAMPGLNRDEAVNMLLAGHESTANTLAWSCHLLSKFPEIQARVHAEVNSVIGSRRPAFADLAQLPLTRAVFSETLRLYPPDWVMGRRAIKDVSIGPYLIPGGSVVLISSWMVHHDRRFHDDPERFDPDRWLRSEQRAATPLSYFPFGAGHRHCIGEQFAWAEGVVVLSCITQRWELLPEQNSAICEQFSVTLRPKPNVQVTVKRRHPSTASRTGA